MLVRRRPGILAVLPMLIAVSACGATATAPSATPTAAPAATVADKPTAASAPASSAVSTPSPSHLDGQILFEDSGPDFSASQLWLENADGSNVRQVLTDDSFDTSASLSPDGTRIVFSRILTDAIDAAVADPSLFGVLTLLNVDGSGLHEINTGDRAKLCDEAPEGDAWSPDGSRLVYVRYCFDKKAQFVEGGIWTVKADGTDPRRVTKLPAASSLEDHRAGWSPGWDVARLRTDRHLGHPGARGDLHDRDRWHGAAPGHRVVGRRERPRLVARWHRDRLQRVRRAEPDPEHLDDPPRRKRPHPAHHERRGEAGDLPSHVVTGRRPHPVLPQPVGTRWLGRPVRDGCRWRKPARARLDRAPREPRAMGPESRSMNTRYEGCDPRARRDQRIPPPPMRDR